MSFYFLDKNGELIDLNGGINLQQKYICNPFISLQICLQWQILVLPQVRHFTSYKYKHKYVNTPL